MTHWNRGRARRFAARIRPTFWTDLGLALAAIAFLSIAVWLAYVLLAGQRIDVAVTELIVPAPVPAGYQLPTI